MISLFYYRFKRDPLLIVTNKAFSVLQAATHTHTLSLCTCEYLFPKRRNQTTFLKYRRESLCCIFLLFQEMCFVFSGIIKSEKNSQIFSQYSQILIYVDWCGVIEGIGWRWSGVREFFFLHICVYLFRCCVSPRRIRGWRSVWRACVKKTPSWGRVWPLYTHVWLCTTNSTSSTASRCAPSAFIHHIVKTHERLDTDAPPASLFQTTQSSSVWSVYEWTSLNNKGDFPLPARVSVGLWKTLLNNHLIPVIVTFTHSSGFHLCSSVEFHVGLEAGIWHVRISLAPKIIRVFKRCLTAASF